MECQRRRQLHHLPPMIRENSEQIPEDSPEPGMKYWKSLDALAETPGFQDWIQDEFPQGASMLQGFERRGFMKIMAASFGLAGLGMTGCRRPEQTIMPYGKSPEELIPGVPNYYATSMPSPHGNIPLVVESHSGRPTKIEGNPSYLPFGGSTDVYAQASVLDLYDPDRARESFRKKENQEGDLSWASVNTNTLIAEVSEWTKDGNFAILADRSFSLARTKLSSELKDKGVQFFEYEAIDLARPEKLLSKGLRLDSDGLRVIPNLGKVKRALSLDCDFLGSREPFTLANTRSFMGGRKVTSPGDAKKMNRLYSVESDMTLTGGVADHRLRLDPSQTPAFAFLLAAEVISVRKGDQTLTKRLKELGKAAEIHREWITPCVADLCSKPSQSIVLAGSHLPEEVHVAVFLINQSLGAIGKTINYLPTNDSYEGISELIEKIEANEIENLLFVGGNPVFLTDSFVDWDRIRKKLKKVARFGYSLDETSEFSDLHIAQSHYLESWDLSRTWDQESIVPVQPLIAPLFDTVSDLELLLSLVGSSLTAHDFVKSMHSELEGSKLFDDFLRLGVLSANPSFHSSPIALNDYFDKTKIQENSVGADNLDLLLIPDFHVWDGRFINNGWMHECPNPMTKLTWDNAILISPLLGKKLQKENPGIGLIPEPTMLNKQNQIAPDNANFADGRQKAPVVLVKFGNRSIEGPLYVQPGLADYTIVSSLGMGRRKTGRVGEGAGYDASTILDQNGNRMVSGAKILKIAKNWTYKKLANVQEHWSMEGRAIIREANVDYYSKKEDFAQHMGAESHSPPMWGKDENKSLAHKSQKTPRGNSSYEHPDHNYENSDTPGRHQWGMAIDLTQCTGCSACVVACQSENNIPIVGKDQVMRGREMHWVRLDRYFSSAEREGDEIPSDVQVSFQSISCMHCETAPCESVCPVNATVHDEEGLNAMAYNRCVGTRYCANNCPYKVRRFNFFDWNKRQTDELYKGPLGKKNDEISSMGKNPDVTVRMRGVMEKCTYCVQRIQEAKIQVKVNAQRAARHSSGKDGSDIEIDNSDLKVPDGTILPACSQVCPSDGVAFGDLSDPESRVSKLKNDPRNYSVLGYLNTRPRTTYLAKIRNPNDKMPDFAKKPHSYREYHDKAYPTHHGEGHGEKKETKSTNGKGSH
ncbi:MAG: hydrogenase [Opitutae bacterium]|nr:hydrogenase [Opitutae bacterium]